MKWCPDPLMLHSGMSSSMRSIIIDVVNSLPDIDPSMRTRYLIATSLQYQVQR